MTEVLAVQWLILHVLKVEYYPLGWVLKLRRELAMPEETLVNKVVYRKHVTAISTIYLKYSYSS